MFWLQLTASSRRLTQKQALTLGILHINTTSTSYVCCMCKYVCLKWTVRQRISHVFYTNKLLMAFRISNIKIRTEVMTELEQDFKF